MKAQVKRILPVAGLALALVLGVLWLVFWHGRVSTDDAYVKADVTLISPKVTGYVAEVRVRDNQPVVAGEVLVVIDGADFTAHLAAAEAQRESLIGQLAAQEQAIAQATATAANAAKDYQRAKTLAGEGAVSQKQLDDDLTAHRNAQAALQAAKLQMDVLAAQVKQAAANVDLAALDVSHTEIRAPQAGIVGNRTVQVGQLVRPGAALLYLIPQTMWVEANFKETQLTHMKVGQPVKVKVDALSGDALPAHVDSFAPASGAEFSILPPENATGNFTKVVRRVPVKIVLDGSATVAGLRPGLSTVVTVDTRK